jgi:hypothetical protein
MANHICRFVLAVVLLTAFPESSRAAPVVTAGSDTVTVGDTFTVPISITDAEELISWQFDLSFDPTILRANAVTEGPFLSEAGTKTTLFSPGVIDNGAGQITLVTDSFVDLPPGPSGSGVLANIEFEALAMGVSPLVLSNVFLNFSGSGFETQDGQVTVLPRGVVPGPSPLMLVSLGLGACAAGRWRRVRRHAEPQQLGSPFTWRQP